MEIQLNEKEIEDLRTALIIAIHAEDNDRTKMFFDRIEKIMDKLDEARGLYNPNKEKSPVVDEKRSLSEKILGVQLAGFLERDLDVSGMITVFDIVEHNPDGRTRLERLMEEKLIVALSGPQTEQAIELLNDYPSLSPSNTV